MKNVVLYVVMVTGLTALFVWLKGRNAERAPVPAAMVVSPESGMARPIVLVDVRTPDEYRTGHKEGALNIPADEVEQRAPQLLPDKNAVILLYCRTGKRADKALKRSGRWDIPMWKTCTGSKCNFPSDCSVRGFRGTPGVPFPGSVRKRHGYGFMRLLPESE